LVVAREKRIQTFTGRLKVNLGDKLSLLVHLQNLPSVEKKVVDEVGRLIFTSTSPFSFVGKLIFSINFLSTSLLQ
jgi:hypothetical protein